MANRWFVRHRGLVIGVFSAASSTGQLVFLPAIAHLAEGPGWRWAAGLVTAFALALVPLVLVVLRDSPRRRRHHAVRRRGRLASSRRRSTETRQRGRGRGAARCARRRDSRTFWILFATFWICGWSTNGLIGTHFIPAAHDHGMPATTSANLLALIGIFDIVGTIASGWLTDRVDSRYLLFAYYLLRGLSLLVVPALLGPHVQPEPVRVHPVLRPRLGGDGAADGRAVPPALRRSSGPAWSSAGCSPRTWSAPGWRRATPAGSAPPRGDYFVAWMTAGGLCLVASALCLLVPRRPTGGGHDLGEPVTDSM